MTIVPDVKSCTLQHLRNPTSESSRTQICTLTIRYASESSRTRIYTLTIRYASESSRTPPAPTNLYSDYATLRGLADEAGVVIVATGVVPRPVEHPEHLHAVFVSASVVRFVVVPVRVAEGVIGRDPAPVALLVLISRPRPEVTVAGI